MGWDEGWTRFPHAHPLLVVEDGLHPLEVHGLEGHQHQQRVGVVLHPGVEVGRLRVEEAHGGLGAHVLLITMDRSVVQPWWREGGGTGRGDITGVNPTCRWHWGGVSGTGLGPYLITTSYVSMVSPMELLRSRWPLPTTAHLRHFRLQRKAPSQPDPLRNQSGFNPRGWFCPLKASHTLPTIPGAPKYTLGPQRAISPS